jgi:hypothetical protein
VAVLLSDIDRSVAYLVTLEPEPSRVIVIRGEPVTVTDSLKERVKVGVSAGLYVPLAGAVRVERVGAVVSIVTVAAAVLLLGPV